MNARNRPAKPPLIAIMGTFGESNAGDDILLMSLLDGLRGRRPDARFVVYTGDRSHTARLLEREGFPAAARELVYTGRHGLREPGLPFGRSLQWIGRTVRTIAAADLLLIGPGTQFQDVTRRFRLLFFLARAFLALALGTPFAFIGMGCWKIEGRLCRAALRFAADRAVFLSTRDAGSARDLAALGIRSSILRPLADISFAAVPPTDTRPDRGPAAGSGRPGRGTDGASRPLIGLTLRCFPKENFPAEHVRNYRLALAALLPRVAAETGGRFAFLPFYDGMGFPDTDALEDLRALAGGRAFPVEIRRWSSLAELRALVADCDALIGMRLHSILLAAQAAVPVLAVSSAEKAWRFMTENGLGAYAVRVEGDESSRLPEIWDRLWTDRAPLQEDLVRLRERQRILAGRHIDFAVAALPPPRTSLAGPRTGRQPREAP